MNEAGQGRPLPGQDWRGAWPVALGLLAFTLLLFPEVVFRGHVFFERDVQLVWYAQVEAFARSLAAGSWPLWNPYVSFGHPLLANANAQVLYPPAWINLVLRPPAAYAVLTLFHLLLGAAGLYAYARRLDLSRLAAFLSAAAWVASGPLLSFVNVWHHLAGACWIPWILLGAERALAGGSLRAALPWGAALGMQVLAGSPDMSALTGLLLVAYVLAHAFGRPRDPGRPWARTIAIGALAAAFAVGISAAQWVPSLAAAAASARQSLPAGQQAGWSSHPWSFVEILLPGALTDLPLRPWVRERIFDGGRPFVHALHLGGVVLVLAVMGLGGAPRARRGFFAGAFVLSLLFALGRHAGLHGALVGLIPPLGMLRYPSKAMVLASLACAVLAGMGLDQWRRAASPPGGRTEAAFTVSAWTLAALTAAASALVAFRPERLGPFLLDPAALGSTWAEVVAPLSAKLGVGAAVLGVLLATRRRAPAAAVAGLALVGLWSANRDINPVAPAEFYRYPPPMLDAVTVEDHSRLFVYRYTFLPEPAHQGVDYQDPYLISSVPPEMSVYAGRALAVRLYLMPPVAGSWGLEGSYEPDLLGLYTRPLETWTAAMAQAEGTPAYLRFLQLGAVGRAVALHTTNLEDLVPVRQYQSLLALPIRLFQVPSPLPRAYVVGRTRVADDARALAIVADPAFDPRREAVVGDGPVIESPGAAPGECRILELRPDRVRIEASLEEPGLVVLVDAYDPGWRATVDERPVPVRRVNVAFRGVEVPAGRHVIEYVYRPRPVLVGLGVTLVFLAGAAVAVAAGMRHVRLS